MQANAVIDKIQRLSDESELDRLLGAFDRLPHKARLTKEKNLALPRH